MANGIEGDLPGLSPGSANLLDTENLNSLNKAFRNRDSVLQDDAYQFGDVRVTEEEVIRGVVADQVRALQAYEGEVELQGLKNNIKMLIGAVTKFKDDVYDGNIRRPEDVGHDDITVRLADQTVYAQHAHGQSRPFRQLHSKTLGGSNLGGGTLQVAPVGDDKAGVTGTLADNEWLFFTGDFIDLNADAAVVRTRYVSMDGEDWEPRPHYFQERNTDVQVNTLPGALAKSSYDVDALLGFGTVTTEYVPVAFTIRRGDEEPANPLGGPG